MSNSRLFVLLFLGPTGPKQSSDESRRFPVTERLVVDSLSGYQWVTFNTKYRPQKIVRTRHWNSVGRREKPGVKQK